MQRTRLISAYSHGIPADLASDLVDSFLSIRRDAATRTLGGTAPGKFVESVVQILQHLGTGSYDAAPKVEDFLKNKVEQLASLEDGLRICAARLARAMYSLRSKRNIAHKGAVDCNLYDLRLMDAAAQWFMAELLRQLNGISMQEAGAIIEIVHAPLGSEVEEIDGRRIVHGRFSTREEILVLLRSHYPDHVATWELLESLDRRDGASIRKRLNELYKNKFVQGDSKRGYRLTRSGFDEASRALQG